MSIHALDYLVHFSNILMLAAYSEAIYAAREETREGNETEATNLALSIGHRALDDAELARARAEGVVLRDADVGAIAFGVPA